MFNRTLKIALPGKQSAFLWGPRKTGKSTLLQKLFPDSIRFDLLQTDLQMAWVKRPALLRETLEAEKNTHLLKLPVIIDEVQKIPALLDEVHGLIENRKLRFILCGSSARKLMRGHANLLGGRAWRYELLPLSFHEIPGFNLLPALNRGLLPSHYLSEDPVRSLEAYVFDYLREEIASEGLTRNIPAFTRFLDAVGFCNGEMINFSNISRDCGVDVKTVKAYFQILVDTLLGRFVQPFTAKARRSDLILEKPKFYLFDVGVANFLGKKVITVEKGAEFGLAFEHFIFMELSAYAAYSCKRFDIKYWRTRQGLEVDFILNQGKVAIEVKGTSRLDRSEIRGLLAYQESYHPEKAIVICNENRARVTEGIEVLPWKEALRKLWDGNLF
jgi:uncharacterized protein